MPRRRPGIQRKNRRRCKNKQGAPCEAPCRNSVVCDESHAGSPNTFAVLACSRMTKACLCSECLQLGFDCLAHLARADLGHARLHDVAGAEALVENAGDRLIDEIGFVAEIERVA